MPRIVDFVVVLDDGVRKRHHHEAIGGHVTDFSVQLEVKLHNEWRVVIRYDCAHGFSHVDHYDMMGNQTKTRLDLSFESALTFGDWDINENWQRYRDTFLRGKS